MIARSAAFLCAVGLLTGLVQRGWSADDPFEAESWSTAELLEDYLSNPYWTDAEAERKKYVKSLLVQRPDDLVAIVPQRALHTEISRELDRCLQVLKDAKLRKELLGVIDELLSRRERGEKLIGGVSLICSFLAQVEAYEFAPRLVRYAKGDLGRQGQISAFQALGRIGGEAELQVMEEEWLKVQAARKHRPEGRQDFSKGEMIAYQGSIDRLKARMTREQDVPEPDAEGGPSYVEGGRDFLTGRKVPQTESDPQAPMAAAPVAANWALALSILFFGWGLWKYIRFRSGGGVP